MVSSEISIQTLNHLGIIDEIGLVEQSDWRLGRHVQEMVSVGQVAKAIGSQRLSLGYRLPSKSSQYGAVEQAWVIVESELCKQADIKQLHCSIDKLKQHLNQ